MKLPFPKWILVTPVKIYSTYISEDGEPIESLILDGMCNYSEKTKQTLDKERKLITLVGKIICEGDIYPNKILQGYIEIQGNKRDIYRVSKPRNPDGSIFSTEIELI
ncbi:MULTISPECIES: hypothetical protein [Clostridioides]|uniref:hypothetical protein n=1 Tax=Clostridioides sp. ES-W-0016-02 TaxID=2770788 RepID=UPI001CA49E6D|nr:hypothetical protein [Clostridioides difficile]MDI0264683.1 hypothetical protein [Clostridioides difficile]UDN60566.1 hypothetical protein IC758_11945 [Clostridioides sp. ES-W-0016-02]